MNRIRIHLLAFLLIFAATISNANAVVILNYANVGADLVFNYSGSLNVGAAGVFSGNFATIGNQDLVSGAPTFYSTSNPNTWGSTLITYTGPNNPGLFASNAPAYIPNVMPGSTSTGTSFLFRVNNAVSGLTTVDMWGNWGAANSPIAGVLTIANQSIASMGIVNGYTLSTSAGDVIFQQASVAAAPEINASKATLPIVMLLAGLLLLHDRRRSCPTLRHSSR